MPRSRGNSGRAASDDIDDSSDGSSPANHRGRSPSISKRGRKRALSDDSRNAGKPAKRPDKRVKSVNLKELTSISSSGGSPSAQSWEKTVRCYGCGKIGHVATKCPKNSKR